MFIIEIIFKFSSIFDNQSSDKIKGSELFLIKSFITKFVALMI